MGYVKSFDLSRGHHAFLESGAHFLIQDIQVPLLKVKKSRFLAGHAHKYHLHIFYPYWVDGVCRELRFKPAKYGSDLGSLRSKAHFLIQEIQVLKEPLGKLKKSRFLACHALKYHYEGVAFSE